MMKENQYSTRDKFYHIFVAFIIQFLLLVIDPVWLEFLPELRFWMIMPLVFGIMWGGYGAIGIFIGHMLGYYCGFLIFPDDIYRPWYMYLNAGVVWSIESYLFYLVWNSRYFNYNDTDEYSGIINFRGLLKFDIMVFLITFLGVLYMTFTNARIEFGFVSYTFLWMSTLISTNIKIFVCTLFIVNWTNKYYCPRIHRKENLEKVLINRPVSYMVTKGLFSFAFLFFCFLALTRVVSGENFLYDIQANSFYMAIFYFGFMFILYWMERNVTIPLSYITDRAIILTNHDYSKEIPVVDYQLHRDNEISVLSDNMQKMAESMHKYVTSMMEMNHERKKMAVYQERVTTELEIAMQIQCAMLPSVNDINDKDRGITVSAMMNPAREVGGDFYDFGIIDDDHSYITVADVSGKGVPAAMFMAVAVTAIRGKLRMDKKANEIMDEVNEKLCENNPQSMFATCFFAVFDKRTRKMSYINAGHTKPLLIHSDGSDEYIKKKSGPMLAGMDGINYKIQEIQLNEGDILLLFTDGITEAENNEHEFYEYKRLIAAASKLQTEKERKNAVTHIYDDVKAFTGTAPQSDDITLVSMYVE